MQRTPPDVRTSFLRTNLRQIVGLIALGLAVIAALTTLSFFHFSKKCIR